MRVEVTAEDIAQGQHTDMFCCPIARACCRAYGIEQKVTGVVKIGIAGFYVRRLGQTHEPFDAPLEAQRFIHEFDFGRIAMPFSFDLPDIPDLEDA